MSRISRRAVFAPPISLGRRFYPTATIPAAGIAPTLPAAVSLIPHLVRYATHGADVVGAGAVQQPERACRIPGAAAT